MSKKYIFYVYILASKRNGTLYIGVTKDLLNRSFQHKLKQNPKSFTAKYNTDRLVYFEEYQYIQDAILRETQLKKWAGSTYSNTDYGPLIACGYSG